MDNQILNSAFANIAGSLEAGLVRATASAPHKKTNVYRKVTIEEVTIKNALGLQFGFYFENKVTHENYTDINLASGRLEEVFNWGYKQWDVIDNKFVYKLIVNKKGNFKRIEGQKTDRDKAAVEHNKEKNYVLKEGRPLPMLISLGLMNKEGRILSDKQKKFRQINKFLEIVESIQKHIPQGAAIVDFGCGKSYLTFALYYYLNEILDKRVAITGLDLKADVVAYCNHLAGECEFTNLKFYCADINGYEADKKISLMVTLHACDTATDYALGFAVKNNVKVILSVPCCQHEVFYQVENEILFPMLKHGILKERFASLLTDGARGAILEACNYKVNIMEFVDMEHTPKNIMIRAVKTSGVDKREKIRQYEAMAKEYNMKPTLETLLKGELYGS